MPAIPTIARIPSIGGRRRAVRGPLGIDYRIPFGIVEMFDLGGELTGWGGTVLTPAGTVETVAGHGAFANASRFLAADSDELSAADSALLSAGATDHQWLAYWTNLESADPQCMIRKWNVTAGSGEYRSCYSADATSSFEYWIEGSDDSWTHVQPDSFVTTHGAIQTARWYLALQGFDYGPHAPNHGRLSVKIGDASTGNVSPSWDFAAHDVTGGGIRDGTNALKIAAAAAKVGPVFLGRNPPGGWEAVRDQVWAVLWNSGFGRTPAQVAGGA